MRMNGYVVPQAGNSSEQLKTLIIQLGEWILEEGRHDIGILFDLNSLADVRVGRMPRQIEMIDDREVPVVGFKAFPHG